MSVFYKFKSALTFDTIQFDDLHISLQDFKKAVIQRSQPGKSTNFDLQVTNAETNEVYSEDNALIPKNSSLIVVRVPLSGTQKKAWDGGDHMSSKIGVLSSHYYQENPGSIVVKSADLAALNASEEDKIKAMMFQSNVDYDPANYSRIRGVNQTGDPPPSYICHKCQHPGHWIKDCPITVVPDIKKSSGIPQSFMTPVNDASVPGALMTPTGTFAVPTIDMHAYKEGKKEKPFLPSEETETSSKPIIPEDLLCTICQDILTDAVMMPCCGNSFCDECIRNILIESEDNQCPDCKEKDTSPETLIPNRFLRNAVNTFRNKTGYKGGGHRVKRSETEATKSPAIEQDTDVEIIGTVSVEAVKKTECEPISETGSAIIVLGSAPPNLHQRNTWMPTNGSQKLPNIHVEHRPPLGRPKMTPDNLGPDSSRPVGYVGGPPTTVSSSRPNLSSVVISHSNGVRLSPDTGGDSERKRSSPGVLTPVNRIPQLPNTSQLPPGFNPSTMPPLNSSYGSNVRPIMTTYGPPGGVSGMSIPPHMTSQSGPVRMYPPYSNQNVYSSQMNVNYRSAPSHHRLRPHHTNPYNDRPVVDDPLEAFERHLRERERQDRMRRNRSRRSRSHSPSRAKSRSRSRQRSRSRSVSKKRTDSKSLSPRKESPQIKRDSRSPVLRRSKSRSRSHSRLRSDSIDRNSMPPSKSPSPVSIAKKKRTDSISPSSVNFKKRSRSASPLVKKPARAHRSRSRSRSRSKSANRAHKRRRTRSRSRSVSSRSISRGRSFSRSPSPSVRPFHSPSHSHRVKRSSRSPPRHQYSSHQSRHRGSHYHEPSPYHNSSNTYDQNDHRYKRGGRGSRYQRGSRYPPSSQTYEGGHNKYERYPPSSDRDRFDEKRFVESNSSRPFFPPNEPSRSRRENYHHTQSPAEFDQYYHNYGGEVAPPGTTDVSAPAVAHFTPTPFVETAAPAYHERRSGSVDRYHRRSPAEYEERGAPPRAYKEPPPDDYKKPRDYERRRSRERHSHHREPEQHRKRHHSRSRAPSQSPPSHRNRKHRSRGRSVDKENKTSRADRGVSNKRESPDRGDEQQRHHVLHEKVDQEGEKRLEPEDRKDEYKEKKEKSKRKKKKESEVEKKKRKKVKTSKKEEPKAEETLPAVKEETSNDEKPAQEEPAQPVVSKNDSLYGDLEGATVDTSIIENYGKLESEEVPEKPKKDLILAAVPELSKWERDDVSSPSEERAGSRRISDDKKMVTSEILKRAENALFQKSTSKSRSESKEAPSKEDPLESTREARKSGNSIQVTVPAVGSKSEDESRLAALGRVSAKDRLGAKVEEKNYATVRSLVEPKIKSRAVSSTVKCVTDVKHSLKSEAERVDREKRAELRRVEEKRRREKESRHSEKPSRHRSDPKERKRDEEHHARKEKEKRSSKHEESHKESADLIVLSTNSSTDKPSENSASVNEAKSILEKKRPCLDEATFEPDYDLTSESEGEIEKERKGIEPEEPVRKSDLEVKNAEKATPKTKEPSNEATSSESSTDSSSDSSAERRKRKKRKSKKKKRVKKRKTYSTDSESEESSESDSDSDSRSKRKKKHRHKTKKASRSAKKKKRSRNKHR